MQFVRKFIGPKDLRMRRRNYYNLLKKNLIYDFKTKDIDDQQKERIYSFYKQKVSKESGYGTSLTKKLLLKSTKNRCCFCGRYICENNKYNLSQNYKYLAIEHYKEECRYPLNILDWKNLFPSCNECNNRRDSKQISYQNSPSDRKFGKDLKKILFFSNGEIISENSNFEPIFDAYGLNSDELMHQRSDFFKQIINPYFKKLLKLEREKNLYHCNAIIFIDEYFNVLHRKKVYSSLKKCNLYKISKEVLASE